MTDAWSSHTDLMTEHLKRSLGFHFVRICTRENLTPGRLQHGPWLPNKSHWCVGEGSDLGHLVYPLQGHWGAHPHSLWHRDNRKKKREGSMPFTSVTSCVTVSEQHDCSWPLGWGRRVSWPCGEPGLPKMPLTSTDIGVLSCKWHCFWASSGWLRILISYTFKVCPSACFSLLPFLLPSVEAYLEERDTMRRACLCDFRKFILALLVSVWSSSKQGWQWTIL